MGVDEVSIAVHSLENKTVVRWDVASVPKWALQSSIKPIQSLLELLLFHEYNENESTEQRRVKLAPK